MRLDPAVIPFALHPKLGPERQMKSGNVRVKVADLCRRLARPGQLLGIVLALA